MSTSPERSRIMRAVKDRDTKPELIVRRIIHSLGYRYRLHRKDLPGKPDIVFPSRRAVIFVHGCFWHGHKCKRGDRQPKTNAAYWKAKIAGNKARDFKHRKALAKDHWRALAIWECEIRDADALKRRLRAFLGGKLRQGRKTTLR